MEERISSDCSKVDGLIQKSHKSSSIAGSSPFQTVAIVPPRDLQEANVLSNNPQILNQSQLIAEKGNFTSAMEVDDSPRSVTQFHELVTEESLGERIQDEEGQNKAKESDGTKSVESTVKSAAKEGILLNKPARDSDVTNPNEKQVIFKKPTLLTMGPPRAKVVGIFQTEGNGESINQSVTSNVLVEKPNSSKTSTSCKKVDAVADIVIKPDSIKPVSDNLAPIPYKEPSWAGYPSRVYGFEIIRGGKIIEQFDLSLRSSHSIGRLPICDIALLHPTISRFHAIIQYRDDDKGTPDNPPGLYVYDLGSTHGTFLNKNRIKARMYVRIHVGHILKFGCSTRHFVLKGPQEDQEEESVLSVTQILTQRNNELIRRKLEHLKGKVPDEEQGISWGMDDDADEETDLTINPFASSNNEDLYIDDPKKTLRGWFEREGHELVYNVEEKASGQFLCQIDLPVDTARGGIHVAEALVKGKKKDAVLQGALEACRVLDRYGLLRQATHESKKRKAKDWEADDFYDSDDDTFLDRTGTVEKKRKARMEAQTEPAVLTYADLMKKYEALMADLREREAQMREANARRPQILPEKTEAQDELDAYMHTITNCPGEYDKALASRLKVQISELKKEANQTRHMINLVRLPGTPELQAESTEETVARENVRNRMAAICSRTKKMLKQKKAGVGPGNPGVDKTIPRKVVSKEKIYEEISNELKEADEEEDEEQNETSVVSGIQGSSANVADSEDGGNVTREIVKAEGGTLRENEKREVLSPRNKSSKTIAPQEPYSTETGNKDGACDLIQALENQPLISVKEAAKVVSPQEVSEKNEDELAEGLTNTEDLDELGSDDEVDKDGVDKEEARRKKRNKKRIMKRNAKSQKERHARWTESERPHELFSEWTPPQGQSGDGRTSLNDKLGY